MRVFFIAFDFFSFSNVINIQKSPLFTFFELTCPKNIASFIHVAITASKPRLAFELISCLVYLHSRITSGQDQPNTASFCGDSYFYPKKNLIDSTETARRQHDIVLII